MDKAGFQMILEPERYAPRLIIKQPSMGGTGDPLHIAGTFGLKTFAYRTIFPKNDKNVLYDRAMKDCYVNLLLHRDARVNSRTREAS
jgi:hypothetical protein